MEKSKLKIGLLTHNYPRVLGERKDAGIFLQDFVSEIENVFQVFVFSPDLGGSKEKYKQSPVTWFSWGGPTKKLGDWNFLFPSSWFYFIKLIFTGSKKAVNFAKTNNIDYCLAAWSIPSGLYAYFVKKILGTPYGVWNLGSDLNKYSKFPVLRQLIILSLRNADHVFANSYDLVKKARSLSGKKVYLLPAVTKFKDKTKKRIHRKTNTFKFLFVGRLEKVKGPDVLIDGVINLRKLHPKFDFTVDILGGGNLETQIREKIWRHKLSDNIYLRGWANESTVAKFMTNADCLLITSRSESLPLVLLEAARFGLAVIASDVGDCPFLIKKYNIGLSFVSENSADLASSMVSIAKSGKINMKNFKSLSKDFSLDSSSQFFITRVSSLFQTNE